MIHFRTRGLSRRGIVRAAVAAVATVAAAGAVSVGTALPAQAAECATQGHVYVTSVSPWSIRYESQPLNGGTDDYQMFAASATTFQVGGNGLQRYTTPTWTVSSSTGAQFSFAGRAAGSNCVANETWVTVPAQTQPGEVWTVSATYQGGNSDRFVQNQAHFRVFFIAVPPPPPYDPPPYDPCPYGYAEACF
jgi:hypothetical protein